MIEKTRGHCGRASTNLENCADSGMPRELRERRLVLQVWQQAVREALSEGMWRWQKWIVA